MNLCCRNYECRGILPLNYCSVIEIFGGSENTDAGGLVKLTCRSKSFLLYSNDRLEIQAWSEALKDTIKYVNEDKLFMYDLFVMITCQSDFKLRPMIDFINNNFCKFQKCH